MCYSAMVKQGIKKGLHWNARIQTDRIEEIFRRRAQDDSIKIAKAFETNFSDPRTPAETEIKRAIDDYHRRKTVQWETEIFKQRKRLADAERKLKEKETKKALEDRRIAGDKVSSLLQRIADLNRTTLVPEDSRIFPFWYAPVLIMEDSEFVITPMRYHLRPNGKPAWYDRRFPGLYNARRDNLEKFWKESFGRRHAVLVMSGFYENVARHDYEKRALRPGEKEENVVLQFNPRPAAEMYVACIWDRWQSSGHRTSTLSPSSPTTHRPRSPPPATTAARYRSSPTMSPSGYARNSNRRKIYTGYSTTANASTTHTNSRLETGHNLTGRYAQTAIRDSDPAAPSCRSRRAGFLSTR